VGRVRDAVVTVAASQWKEVAEVWMRSQKWEAVCLEPRRPEVQQMVQMDSIKEEAVVDDQKGVVVAEVEQMMLDL